jgi:hypothetical protein
MAGSKCPRLVTSDRARRRQHARRLGIVWPDSRLSAVAFSGAGRPHLGRSVFRVAPMRGTDAPPLEGGRTGRSGSCRPVADWRMIHRPRGCLFKNSGISQGRAVTGLVQALRGPASMGDRAPITPLTGPDGGRVLRSLRAVAARRRTLWCRATRRGEESRHHRGRPWWSRSACTTRRIVSGAGNPAARFRVTRSTRRSCPKNSPSVERASMTPSV